MTTGFQIPTIEKTKAKYLSDLGLYRTPAGFVEIEDEATAQGCYIHHTLTPIAALGWRTAAPAIARRRLADVDLFYLIDRRFNMDSASLQLFAQLCGADDVVAANGFAFNIALRSFLRYRDMSVYFGEYLGKGHHAIRPRGFAHDERTSLRIPEEMEAWRTGYAAEPEDRQIMIASLVCLYRGGIGENDPWLSGLPHRWNAVDALDRLSVGGYLADWGRLVALCPGW